MNVKSLIGPTLRRKHYADGGGDLSDADQAALSPETYVNPVAKGIVGAVGNLAMLPKRAIDAATEDVQHFGEPGYQDQAVGPAVDTAMTMVGGAGAVPAEANALRTGIGIGARDIGQSGKLTQFMRLEGKNVSPEMNYSMTGWYRGNDGQPRFWVNDEGAKLNTKMTDLAPEGPGPRSAEVPPMVWQKEIPGKGTDPGIRGEWRDPTVGDIWDHPALFEAYPWLKDIPVKPETNPEYGGHYSPGERAIYVGKQSPQAFEDVLHHEVVHAIQHYEGFTNGANANQFLTPEFRAQEQKFRDIEDTLHGRAKDAGIDPLVARIVANKEPEELSPYEKGIYQTLQGAGLLDKLKTLSQANRQINQIKGQAFQRYLHISGESEARDAPFIRRKPEVVKPWQLPLNVNPELQPGRPIEMGPVMASGGAIKMADGGAPAFDPTKPFEPVQDAAPAFDPSKPFEPIEDATPSVGGDIAKEGGKGLMRGAESFAGDLGEAVMGPFGPSHHLGNLLADLGLGARPQAEPGYGQQLATATGMTPNPQTTAGKYAGSIGEVAGNPASYLGPGSVAGKLASAAATGAGSEGAGELAQQYAPALEPYARIAGGILGGSAAGTVAAGVENSMRARGIPTTQDLHAASQTAYANARNLGVEYTPGNLQILRDQIRRDLIRQGHRADLSGATFRRIDELPNPPTPATPGGTRNFSDVEGVRQSLNQVYQERTPLGRMTADARAAGVAIDHIDGFLGDPTKALAGQQGIAVQSAQFAREGRSNWGAMMRSSQIEEALQKAGRNAAVTGSGANIDNTLRQQVRNILNNPRRAKNFTDDDRAMMEDIVAGNPIRNSARLVGKLATTGAVSLAATNYLAHTMGLGLAGHAATAGIGYGMKKAGDIMTRNRYQRLLESVRMDSALGRANPVGPRASAMPYALRSAATTNPYAPP